MRGPNRGRTVGVVLYWQRDYNRVLYLGHLQVNVSVLMFCWETVLIALLRLSQD